MNPLRWSRAWKSSHPATGSPSPAASVVGYLAVITLLGKVARAIELTARTGSLLAWTVLPLSLGQDLILIGCAGLCAYALRRVGRPNLRIALVLLVLVPIGALTVADVLAYRLTGAPVTWQRIRGEEGATLGDLDLLDAWDLAGGLAGIAFAWACLWPALRHAHRIRPLVRWARPKSLLATLLLGAVLGVVQNLVVPNTHGLADQPLFVLAESFTGDDSPAARSLADREWEALLRPALPDKQPDMTPPRADGPARNVVIFLSEGIPYKHTGFAPDRPRGNPTRNLVRRQKNDGLLFDRYYANWHASIQALFSVVCSAFPPIQGDIVRIKPRIDCGEFSEVMRARGVVSGLFHAGDFAFYNKLALLGRRAYAIETDAEELAKTSSRKTHQWGIDDRAMVEATLQWIDSLPKGRRFAALMIPITAHYPYWVPRDFRSPVRKRGSRLGPFLDAVAFQDEVFEQLLRGFEERGLYDDTLFVWLGDHGHAVSEPPRITPGVRGVYQANLHVPLVLINRRLFPKSLATSARVSHRVGAHPDLLPTILDALGERPDPRHQGQSLLSPHYRPRRAFFAAQNGRYLGFVEHDRKFVLHNHTGRTEYYDLGADPEEMTDLSARDRARMTAYAEEVRRFAGGVRARIEAAPVLTERVSVRNVYTLFRRDVEIALVDGDQRIPCTEGASREQRTCPDLGDVLREKTGKVQGEKRHCLFVRVPEKGAIELVARDPDVLALLHGTIVAVPGSVKAGASFKIATDVDGAPHGSVRLGGMAAARPQHPRARRELRYRISRVPDADAPEVCLQLTTLVQ